VLSELDGTHRHPEILAPLRRPGPPERARRSGRGSYR
jgi:hypothetical protein